MYREYKVEQKRKERHQHELSKAYKKAKLKLVKNKQSPRKETCLRYADRFFYVCRAPRALRFGLFFDPTHPQRRKGS